MKEWLSLSEYCSAEGISRRTFFRRSVPSRTIAGTLRYSAASLSVEARATFESKLGGTAEEPLNKRPAETSLSLAPLFTQTAAAAAASAPQPVRVALSPEQEMEAQKKLEVLQPLLDFLEYPTTRDRFAQLRLKDGRSVTTGDLMSFYLSELHGVSRSTIWNWKRAFDRDGRFGLVRKVREDKGRSGWATEHRELADIAASVYIGTPEAPAQSKTIAWEMVCSRAKTMGLPAPSYQTVRTFLDNPAEVSPSMRVMGREGRKKYDAQFAPYIRRGYTEPANAIWVSDHAIVDVLAQNDLFAVRDLKHIRLRMTTIMDYRSRFVVGTAFAEEGSSHAIKRALLRGISRYGLPDAFYCDNGKDYRSVARNADRLLLQREGELRVAETRLLEGGALKRLGIPVIFCTPYHPQAKHIERYHRTFHERVDKAYPSYTGSASHLRPDHTTDALAKHGKLLQMGQTAQYSALPLASEYIRIAESWIANWYHQRPQENSEGMNGRSPAQCFLEETNPNQRLTPEPQMLAMLLAERTTRKVQNCAVTLGGVRLVPGAQDMAAQFQMHELSGREAVVLYDPIEPNFAAVLDADGHFLCKLEAEQLFRMAGFDPQSDDKTRADLGTFIQNRNGLAKAVKQSARDLRGRVAATGVSVSAEAALRELAQLPEAVGQSTVHRPGSQAGSQPQDVSDTKSFHSDDIADWFLQQRQGGF